MRAKLLFCALALPVIVPLAFIYVRLRGDDRPIGNLWSLFYVRLPRALYTGEGLE
jgi:hypothetical protein